MLTMAAAPLTAETEALRSGLEDLEPLRLGHEPEAGRAAEYEKRHQAGNPAAGLWAEFNLMKPGRGEARPRATLESRIWADRNRQAGIFGLLQALAEKEDPRAQAAVAMIYAFGLAGRNPDEALAWSWYRQAARQGLVAARYNLAVMLIHRRGLPVDLPETVTWLEEAADRDNDAESQLVLGLVNLGGERFDEAVGWFIRASDQGLGEASYLLGSLYADGLGVPKNPIQAVGWYEKAAGTGHREAQYQMGLACAGGLGLKRDPVRAADWFEKAARQGHAGAQSALARLYETGRGVAKNPDMAKYWLDRSQEEP
jgi:TPR repeat protein